MAERWILARLRNRTFFSLAELNDAIGKLLDDINGCVMRHWGESPAAALRAARAPGASAYALLGRRWHRACGPMLLPLTPQCAHAIVDAQ